MSSNCCVICLVPNLIGIEIFSEHGKILKVAEILSHHFWFKVQAYAFLSSKGSKKEKKSKLIITIRNLLHSLNFLDKTNKKCIAFRMFGMLVQDPSFSYIL